MKSAKVTLLIFQFLSIVLFQCGYIMAKVWPGVIILLCVTPCWWISHRLKTKLMSSGILFTLVGVSAYGLLNRVSPSLMIAGVATALACWELEDQILSHSKIPSFSLSTTKNLFEIIHLKILGITITSGLVLAEACLFLKLSLPFGVVFLVAIVVCFSIFQLFSILKRA